MIQLPPTDPVLHTFHTDQLSASHPLANESVYCTNCGVMLHAFNNECMQEWLEWPGITLCLECGFKLLNIGITIKYD